MDFRPLLDLSRPTDIALLEACTNAVAQPSDARLMVEAQAVLTQLKEHPDAWMRVPQILEQAQSLQAKFYSLQVLEEAIKFRWGVLPKEERSGIRSFVVSLIMRTAASPEAMTRDRPLLNKLDLALVQILKHDWTENWSSFVPEIVEAARSSESVCENTMTVLKLLSEEIFDFSRGDLTSSQVAELKGRFESEFSLIYQFCEYVLMSAKRPSLLNETLMALRAFLAWIPSRFIYETKLLETLVVRLFPANETRNNALGLMAEVASIGLSDDIAVIGRPILEDFYRVFVSSLSTLLPVEADFNRLYSTSEDAQTFLLQLALFFSNMFRTHLSSLEGNVALHVFIHQGHRYLVNMLRIEEKELFKIVAEYWLWFVSDLYADLPSSSNSSISAISTSVHYGLNVSRSFRASQQLSQSADHPGLKRLAFYNDTILRAVRVEIISHMQRPEEVLISRDEEGKVTKERLTDVDVIALYKTQRETLIYLSNLDRDQTRAIMRAKLDAQRDRTEWSWDNLNRLCWAIGSLSGTLDEETEKEFLVEVIRELLELCEHTSGKDNKAVIASNIMYVVGQYPRFLVNHWKFLKTVVNKLFEFMHETFEGVQEMAVETFLKIAKRCRRKFAERQSEPRPFIEDIISSMDTITSDLSSDTNHMTLFYEALGWIISSASSEQYRLYLVAQLCARANGEFAALVLAGQQSDTRSLQSPDVMRSLTTFLKTNVAVCSSCGASNFIQQLGHIFLDLMQIYRIYSQLVVTTIMSKGPVAAGYLEVKLARKVKKMILTLVSTFIENLSGSSSGSSSASGDVGADVPASVSVVPSVPSAAAGDTLRLVATQFVAPLLESVLMDYSSAPHPSIRDEEVLELMTVLISFLPSDEMAGHLSVILDHTFEPTLRMITDDLHSFPGHRLHLFRMIRAIVVRCFSAMFSRISQQHFKFCVDSGVWAAKHTDRESSETGLSLLLDLLQNIDGLFPGTTVAQFHNPVQAAFSLSAPLGPGLVPQITSNEQQIASLFYSSYLVPILEAVLEVMTDGAHKAGFKFQALIVMHICHLVALNRVPVAILSAAAPQQNGAVLAAYLRDLLQRGFTNLVPTQTATIVDKWFDIRQDFQHLKVDMRDFLVQLKQFSNNNQHLFEEEQLAQQRALEERRAAVPGLSGAPAEYVSAQGNDMLNPYNH
eukprot:ANDGO_04130.mRNA.1 Protein EXPORTIN 1B